jgi:hypothetical protein
LRFLKISRTSPVRLQIKIPLIHNPVSNFESHIYILLVVMVLRRADTVIFAVVNRVVIEMAPRIDPANLSRSRS